MNNQMNHCNNRHDKWSSMGGHNYQGCVCDNKMCCDYCIGPTGPQGERGLRGCPGPQGERGLRGCPGPQGPRGYPGAAGANGADGADGSSAYELAVAEGFIGTIDEWLEGLTGSTGPAGADGINGTNGKSAYELAVEEGYTGTMDEWLEGLVGETGPAGPIGPAGTTSIVIPFASGEYVNLYSGINGARSTVGIIGFGSRMSLVAPVDPISLSGILLEAYNQAFSMPVSGVITKMSAYFSLTAPGVIGVDNMITAQLYYSSVPDDSFQPVPGAIIPLGTVPGGQPLGMVLHGVTPDLSIPIGAETRLLMVFYNTTPQNITSNLAGFMSAGVKIE